MKFEAVRPGLVAFMRQWTLIEYQLPEVENFVDAEKSPLQFRMPQVSSIILR
jgi:hypothetical protein